MNKAPETSTISTVYLIPIPIAEGRLETLSPEVAVHTATLQHYFVENVRTARRFLRSLHKELVLENIHFSEIDKHNGPDLGQLRIWIGEGRAIGVMSEAGCPGIADPGADIIAVAQAMNASIVPLVGPNSLILALMASGLNGQSFCFTGYIPVKDPDRAKKIKDLEATSVREKQTQIFIETPYRNDHLLADLLKNCQPATRLCIAQNITAPDAIIRTRKVSQWKNDLPVLGKVPAVFLMLG